MNRLLSGVLQPIFNSRVLLVVLLAIGVHFGLVRPVRANIITNGSFEDPILPPGGFQDVLGGDSSTIPGWTVQGNDVLVLQTTYSEPNSGMMAFDAEDGLNAINITGGGNSGPTDGLQQVVATVVGEQYLLSFSVGRAQTDGSGNAAPDYTGPAMVDLSIDGAPAMSYTNSNTVAPGYVGWQEFATSFVASGPTTTITFLNGEPLDQSYAGLDNVVLVPEPGTIVLLAIGAAALIWYSRRSHASAATR